MERTNFTLIKNLCSLLLLLCLPSLVSAQFTCGTATVITATGTYTADVTNTAGGNEPGCLSANGTDAAWFAFTPASCGTIDVSACGLATGDTHLSIYTGACGALTCVMGNDDACGLQSELTGITVYAGCTYFIEWDDRWGSGAAVYDFNFTFTSGAALPPLVNSVTTVGCNTTVDFKSCTATTDIEVCPTGVASGGAGCVTFTGVTSPFAFDYCANGFSGMIDVTASDANGSATSTACLPPPSGVCVAGLNQNVIFSEAFDGGIPAGWVGIASINNGGPFVSACWHLSNAGTPSFSQGPAAPDCAGSYLFVDGSGLASGTTVQFPGPIAIPATAVNANFCYDWHFQGTSVSTVNIEISTDGGLTWANFATHNTGTPAAQADPFVPASVNLNAFIGMSVDFRIVYAVDGVFDDFAIDNIYIKTEEPAPCDIMVSAAVPTATSGCVNDGSIAVSASSACFGPLEYSIDGGATWQASDMFTGLASGNYNVMVRSTVDNTCMVAFTGNPVVVGSGSPGIPTALCQDISVTLDAAGNATITPIDIDNGSTAVCTPIPAITLDLTDFTCADVGIVEVELTATDPITNSTATCTANVTVLGSEFCIVNGFVGINNAGGASFADPCTCDGQGGFNEEVLVVDASNSSSWSIQSVTGLNTSAGGAPYAPGDPLVNNGDNTYSLVGNHADGVGYEVVLESPFYPGLTLGIGNTCFYPIALITAPVDTIACRFTDIIPLTGIGVSQKDGVTPVDGSGAFTVNGAPATELDPGALGVGTHVVEFCFDAGAALGFKVLNVPTIGPPIVIGPPSAAATIEDAQDDPGCIMCVSESFTIGDTPSDIACNDQINVSLDATCQTTITPDQVLEGSYGCFDDYEVTLSKDGNPITNSLGKANIGQDIIATVTHLLSGNNCWGHINVEDKLGPTIDCNILFQDKFGNWIDQDQTADNVLNLDCSIDLASIPTPTATDCCPTTVFLISENNTGDACSVATITRLYGSEDSNGNAGGQCLVTINITQPTVEFPEDITWTCEQYAANSSIVDATALHPLIIRHATQMDATPYCCITGKDGDDIVGLDPFAPNWWLDGEDLDVTLDPNYNDNIDNPITDGDGACGTATTQTDTDDCQANFGFLVGCPHFQDCDIAPPTAHAPEVIQVPIYQGAFVGDPYPNNHPIRGLEDADVLALTGSGQPNVSGLSEDGCKYSVTFKDQKLEACEGVDTLTTFKILRTWTVLNWCTGVVTSDIQVIKVVDKKDPVVSVADATLVGDQYQSGGTSAHPSCASDGPLPAPSVSDNCSGVDVADIRLITPIGEGIPQLDASGNLTGFGIPSPYLPTGVHTVTYIVTDRCGNTTTVTSEVEVEDGIPPVPVCREITQVALGSEPGGVTAVEAKYFDEGSYDNCSAVFFKVKRMERRGCDNANVDTPGEIGNPAITTDDQEWFDDKVKFCCEDIGDTVVVILRVYDVDPGFGEVNTNQSAANNFTHRNGRRNGISYNDQFLRGTYNDCMIEVILEDKARPACTAPEDVWAMCSDIPANADLTDTDVLQDMFGTATGWDNCDFVVEELTPNVQIDLCGVGTVTRDFRTVDTYGNRSIGRCRQTIMVMAQNSYKITIPGDFDEECDDAAPAEVTFEEYACDLLAVNREVKELIASPGGECKKELITYRIINWCEYDGVSQPLTLPRRDLNNDGNFGDGTDGSGRTASNPRGYNSMHMYVSNGDVMNLNDGQDFLPSTGYYEYIQHVKIFDNTAPVLTYDGDNEFCGGDLDEDPCTGQVDITIDIDELCTSTTSTWELSAFATTFGAADFSGSGSTFSGRYPLGTHTVRFYVEDECGNTSQLDVTFEIIDCKHPTPVCHNGLSVTLMPTTRMVEVWAVDFDASSFDYCHDICFEVNVVTDRNRDGFITPDDYLTTLPGDTSVVLDCSHRGITMIQLWAIEKSDDGVNQADYCVTYIDVQDNGVCPGSRPATIGGKVTNESGTSVSNVDVTLSGASNNSMLTANDGNFDFNVTVGNDYSVTPMRNDDVRNGVSTYDLALISKHVLSVELLDSPYKMIAADANQSGNISTLDLVAIRKVILWVANDFPNNTSWRFVDKDQILNPTNPFADAINEVKNINNAVDGLNQADFIAVKVGDVSGDAEPQDLNTIDDRTFNGTFFLNTEDKAFEAGDVIEVPFTSDLKSVLGYQFTMNFNTKVLALNDIIAGAATKENFGTAMVDNGILTASWNGTTASQDAFTISFTAKQAGKMSEVLSISSEYTTAEAYTTGGSLQNVGINFGTTQATTEFALYQNTPNPFVGTTTIGFELPEATSATLTISDVTGKVVRIVEGDYAKGYNVVTLEMNNDLPAGVLLYELKTATQSATRKMTVVK